ncbi:amino acid transporter [Candidatus Nitrosoglobus terrae]|uniref:Amino acid transporter n=1 Tax=Candidatus Nitrosoglobus terrae TaxID=1630141 RepID=A0A1Q2SNH0_9GAMM|nr:amino acid permease [Candidatus Nitrosoglobus terrae]BAW80686.1 amino acid transporter [Candidatus Nitrosoglobus terrae]
MAEAKLVRSLGLGTLIFYGIGDILGAGIYALVGKVAGVAGNSAWVSFMAAGILALITGLSYAELGARIPHSAGASAYCGYAFKQPFISFLIGALVLFSGIASTATAALAFQGYLSVLANVPTIIAALLLITAINSLSFIGIRQSALTNNLFTIIEFAGLLFFTTVALQYAFSIHTPTQMVEALTPDGDTTSIITGVTIAFYAFIGFEDMVNLAEEAKNPTQDLPRAILIAITVTSLLYLLVIIAVQLTMTPEAAGASDRPLLSVLELAGLSIPAWVFALIAIIAISNTALANSIMASRLMYGMARQGLLPQPLAWIHPHRHTPGLSILVTVLLTLIWVITGGVTLLAQTTGFLLVSIFLCVHLSLIRIRQREGRLTDRFTAPAANPYLGVLLCLALIYQFPSAVYIRMAVLLFAIGILFKLIAYQQK